MRDYEVDVKEVLETLKKNLEQHRKDYLEAHEGFKVKAKAAAKDLVKRIDNSQPYDKVNLSLGLTPPVSYEKQYEEVIFCFSMEKRERVTLDSAEMARYMMDKWDWSESFNVTKSIYNSISSARG